MSDHKPIKKPIAKGVAKVPVVIQLEALECGAACLAMVMAYYDKWIPLEQVRKDCGVSRDGSSAVNVLKAGRSYGFDAKGFRFEPEDLKKFGKFPCIIHWNFNHFVVLNGFKGNTACLNDPAKGTYTVPMETFDKSFTGICLMLEPGENFEPSGKPKSIRAFAGKYLKDLKGAIAISVITTLFTSLIGIMTPVFDNMFYDKLLTGYSSQFFKGFMVCLTALYFIQLSVMALTAVSNLRINGKMNIVGNLSYMWKVLHLPMDFFSQRMTGDIASRQSGNTTIANTLVNTLAPLVLNAAMMVFYLVAMLNKSVVLSLVGIFSTTINMIFSRMMSKRRINLSRVQTRDQAKLSSATVSGIQMIETIKSGGAEEGYFVKWSGLFASVNKMQHKFAVENQILTIVTAIISMLANSAMTGIGIYLTIQGQFTVGSVYAFIGLFNAFTSPVNSLINAGNTIQEMRTAMERIDDVMAYPDDPNIQDIPPKKGEEIRKLSGEVEIKNITFGYSPLAEPLIKDFSMSVKRGSRVAFVGASGCGKSTLSKLISGMYVPWSGEILFDGKPIREIDHSVFTGSLAVVDQDITLFEDTVANNIKMWDDAIEDFEMILGAKDAGMHYEIVEKEGGYQHKLTEGGKEFSGGQRQRLEIARVLAQEPNIIILDEATSALDAKTEYNVVKAIQDRGITCIVIAHRLSTIRDCDEIVVLNKGEVVERGTHASLMALKGYYSELITND